MKQEDLLSGSPLLLEQIRRTLGRGSLYSALLGTFSALMLAIMSSMGLLEGMLVPILWTTLGGVYSFTVYILARLDLVRGRIVWVLMMGFICLPTSVYVMAHFALPSGAATYLTGPPSYLYFFLIVVSGLSFDPKMAIASGVLAGISYFACVFWDRDRFSLTGPDPLMVQDATSLEFFFFKALMMVFTGFVVAVLATTARRLVAGVVKQELETQSIKRVLGEFVSHEVAEKVIAQQSGRIAEKREVAILFSDLRGFTEFSETKSAEEVALRLNEYFEVMVAVIEKHGGTIDKFIGDAIMAVFGGVLDLENPSASALRAGMEMRAKMAELRADWSSRGMPPLESGIGIHFGEVLQGTLGPEHRKDFTVIGDTVNAASRIEGLCKEYGRGLIVSKAVFERAQPAAGKLVALGNAKVKGKQGEIEIYGYEEHERG
jgi:adenylate cyclase